MVDERLVDNHVPDRIPQLDGDSAHAPRVRRRVRLEKPVATSRTDEVNGEQSGLDAEVALCGCTELDSVDSDAVEEGGRGVAHLGARAEG